MRDWRKCANPFIYQRFGGFAKEIIIAKNSKKIAVLEKK
jgi:hypothetical protein